MRFFCVFTSNYNVNFDKFVGEPRNRDSDQKKKKNDGASAEAWFDPRIVCTHHMYIPGTLYILISWFLRPEGEPYSDDKRRQKI